MTTLEQLNARGKGYLPGLIGIEFLSLEPGRLTSRLQVRPKLLAPNGYLHTAAVIALAVSAPLPICPAGQITSPPSSSRVIF